MSTRDEQTSDEFDAHYHHYEDFHYSRSATPMQSTVEILRARKSDGSVDNEDLIEKSCHQRQLNPSNLLDEIFSNYVSSSLLQKHHCSTKINRRVSRLTRSIIFISQSVEHFLISLHIFTSWSYVEGMWMMMMLPTQFFSFLNNVKRNTQLHFRQLPIH